MIPAKFIEKRVNANFSYVKGKSRIISITGSNKDFFAANLAASLADIESKKKTALAKQNIIIPGNVLLVDFNLGTPQQHILNDKIIDPNCLGSHENKTGNYETATLYHILDGSSQKLEDLIIKTKVPNLRLILSEQNFRFHQRLNIGIEMHNIHNKIQEKIGGLSIQGDYAEIVFPASFQTFSNFINLATDNYIIVEPSASSLTDALYTMADSIVQNAKRAINNAKDPKSAYKEALPDMNELFDKNKSNIEKLCSDITKREEIHNTEAGESFLRYIYETVKGAEFSFIFDKTDLKDAKDRYVKMMSQIANENLLPGDVNVSFLGVLDYGKNISRELKLLRQSEDSGEPLIFHQYNKKSPLYSEAKRSNFVKSVEDIAKHITFSKTPKGFIGQKRIKEYKK